MVIGTRLRQLRQERNLSQGDIEARTGLLRCYISRVENGHTIPSLETLEKLAQALEVQLFQLFYEGPEPPTLPRLSARLTVQDDLDDQEVEAEVRFLEKIRRLVARVGERDRDLFLHLARELAKRDSLHPSREPVN